MALPANLAFLIRPPLRPPPAGRQPRFEPEIGDVLPWPLHANLRFDAFLASQRRSGWQWENRCGLSAFLILHQPLTRRARSVGGRSCGRQMEGIWKGYGRVMEGRWKGVGRVMGGKWKAQRGPIKRPAKPDIALVERERLHKPEFRDLLPWPLQTNLRLESFRGVA